MMKKTWWGVFAGIMLGLAGNAHAVISSTATLNIDVTVTGSKSVAINTFNASTVTVAWSGTPNAALVSAATATVTNNSGILTETWALSTNASSIDQGTNGAWTNTFSTTSVGNNQFAVQAVFGSSNTVSCPIGTATDWNASYAPPLTTSLVTYNSTAAAFFADTTLTNNGVPTADGGSNGQMYAGDQRALCWRIITPTSVSNTDTQNVQIVVTAQ